MHVRESVHDRSHVFWESCVAAILKLTCEDKRILAIFCFIYSICDENPLYLGFVFDV